MEIRLRSNKISISLMTEVHCSSKSECDNYYCERGRSMKQLVVAASWRSSISLLHLFLHIVILNNDNYLGHANTNHIHSGLGHCEFKYYSLDGLQVKPLRLGFNQLLNIS